MRRLLVHLVVVAGSIVYLASIPLNAQQGTAEIGPSPGQSPTGSGVLANFPIISVSYPRLRAP